MENISKEDISYIKEAFDKKDSYFKPDVKRIIRAYNIVMDDKKHIYHPVSEQICACSLRPYLIQLYRKLEKDGYYNEPEQKKAKASKKKK